MQNTFDQIEIWLNNVPTIRMFDCYLREKKEESYSPSGIESALINKV